MKYHLYAPGEREYLFSVCNKKRSVLTLFFVSKRLFCLWKQRRKFALLREFCSRDLKRIATPVQIFYLLFFFIQGSDSSFILPLLSFIQCKRLFSYPILALLSLSLLNYKHTQVFFHFYSPYRLSY